MTWVQYQLFPNVLSHHAKEGLEKLGSVQSKIVTLFEVTSTLAARGDRKILRWKNIPGREIGQMTWSECEG